MVFMRSQIVNLLLIVISFTPVCTFAQVTTTNPMEIAAVSSGNAMIQDEMGKTTRNQSATAVEQTVIAGCLAKIHDWERKYSAYLQDTTFVKTATAGVTTLRASSTLVIDTYRVIIELSNIYNAAGFNPQGIIATLPINNSYAESFAELASVISLFNNVLSKGGPSNMLNGKERCELLWMLQDKMKSLANSLHHLFLSIRHYQMIDVWRMATAGMLDRSFADVARACHGSWKRMSYEAYANPGKYLVVRERRWLK